MGAIGFDHVQLTFPPGGTDAARRFYGSILGLPELALPPYMAGREGCRFAVGDLELHLAADTGHAGASQAHIAVRIDAFEEVRQRLVDNAGDLGRTFRLDGRDGFFAYDPFGNWIEFVDGRGAI